QREVIGWLLDNIEVRGNMSCQSDINGDSSVDAADLALLLGAWGPCTSCLNCPSDLDADGAIAASDLALLLGAWGPCESSLLGGGESMMAGGAGGAPGAIPAAFGFESLAGYAQWLDGLSEQARLAHIA